MCYAVGSSGTIRKTVDGGATAWTGQTSGTTAYLLEISCIDSVTCYVVGYSGTIRKTVDGGATAWTGTTSGTTEILSGIDCPNNLVCYAVGQNGTIRKTTDGGTTPWTAQTPGDPTAFLTSVACQSADTCITVGLWGGGDIFKTINGGQSWSGFETGHQLWSLDCPAANKCYTGGSQYYLKTIDGTNWFTTHYQPTPTLAPNIAQDYSVITGFKETLDGTSTGTIYYQLSNDDGATWYWYDGTSWSVAPDITHRNTSASINQNIPDFTGSYGSGTGKFKWRAIFYGSSVTDLQKLDSIQVAIRGSAPNKPESLTISDVSNRDKEVWALALSWDSPVPNGTEINFFKIERSDNGGPWTEVGTTNDGTKRAYAEVVPSSDVTYSYRVRSVDHDEIGGIYNDESEPSNVVSMTPTGKYSSPPNLLGTPSANVTATTANISWSTDRVSSSTAKYGIDTGYGLIASDNQTEVTSHSVSLKGLIPGTTYHYKIQSLDPERTYGDDAYYTSDYTFTTSLAAEISDLKVTDIRSDSALLSWQTTGDMGATIHYGKTAEYGSTMSASSGTSHSVRLTGLQDSTTYHLKVIGTDSGGNLVQSDDYSFETLAFPRISNIRFEKVEDKPTSTLKVTWDTNVPTSSVVEYMDPDGTSQEVAEYQMVTRHEIIVSGLKDKTEYILLAKGRDAFGNEASSGRQKITTEIDTRPPEISEITTETSVTGYGSSAKSQMIVSWRTDEPATSQVQYSRDGSETNLKEMTQEDAFLTSSHAVVISGLEPSSPYYFRVISKDKAENESKSEIKSALTDQVRPSVFDIIIESFKSSFDWLFGIKRFK
ncbi:hypothetical protein C4544_01385 [candidate division WS5 bacterium]|uniref:Fibronectin type-III domain-containing protein n=1 Tax=candidate division WS5 bacterium TaxID=2093353 RepID=A0A419DFL3_9BACT|nr:MAG: hypothetical protein C4544_01385 [candidate division WS5 bacterium]